MSNTKRCACGEMIEPGEGWPGEQDADERCQICWEAYCSREWWAMHQAIARVVAPETFPEATDD